MAAAQDQDLPPCLNCGAPVDDPADGYCIPCSDLLWAQALARRAAQATD